MGSRHDEKRMNVESDRLSSLPDNLIHKILSFISLQQAIETSALSSRWRYIWTSMPYLNLSTEGFPTFDNFSKFVTHVLSRRDNQVQLSSANLCFNPGKATQTPKHLMLTQKSSFAHCTLTSSTWDLLPSLTTLYLDGIALNEENDGSLFTNCINLKDLTLKSCQIRRGVNICHPKLSSLTLDYECCSMVNVIAHQLKNLTIKTYDFSTRISLDGVVSLEKVDLSISYPREARTILSLLRQFRCVKFLTINLEIVEVLSSLVELISHQPPPFANLKSLKIYPVWTWKISHRKVNVSSVVENYFLSRSPSAILTMVLREEIRAHKLIKELQGLLNQWKANNDNTTAHADQGIVENQKAQQETMMESQFGERLAEIKIYWSDLNKWSEEGNKRTCRIILILREIESLLIELPASQRARMQPMYFSMYAEADKFMANMMDRVRIQCHKKPRVIVSFYRIAAFGFKSELEEIMDSRHDKKSMNVEGDRLSRLPDDLIHQILSTISLQQAIKTSTLSSRWRYIWTSMPYLDFSTEGFSNFKNFSKFVTRVLSRHDNQVQLSSANFSFHRIATQKFVRKILNYVFSHNIEQLSIVSFQDKIPVNLFSSQSLKHLMLTQKSRFAHCTLTSTWDLPSLTTLYLHGITLTEVNGGDFLTNCTNLKNLTLKSCQIRGGVNICLPNLSRLTLEYVCCIMVNVIAPQLKNLIIKMYEFSTCISLDGVLSLEKVDLSIILPRDARRIVSLVRQFRSVKFLTLNLEILESLSSLVELNSHQPSPFANLKSLKIYPEWKISQGEVNVSSVVENYFLSRSPSATLTMVIREEIRAHELIKELQGLLNQWKANSDNNTAHVDQGSVENERAQQETIMESQFGERLAEIQRYWSDLKKWSEEGDKRTCRIISMLQEIKSLLIELPASQRAKMQPMHSSLHAEADTFMDNMMDRVRIQCDKKPRCSNVHFHELAATSQLLS